MYNPTLTQNISHIVHHLPPLAELMDKLKLSEKDFDTAAHRYSAVTKINVR